MTKLNRAKRDPLFRTEVFGDAQPEIATPLRLVRQCRRATRYEARSLRRGAPQFAPARAGRDRGVDPKYWKEAQRRLLVGCGRNAADCRKRAPHRIDYG